MKFKLLILVLILLFGFTSIGQAKRQLYPSYIKTPIDLTIWFQSYFIYQEDLDGKFKKPDETLKDRGGDCEDYAIFTCYVLKRLGYKCKVIGMWFDDGGHAIAIFKEKDGKLSFFDNGFYYKSNNANILELLSEAYPDWNVMVYFLGKGPLFYKWKVNKVDR